MRGITPFAFYKGPNIPLIEVVKPKIQKDKFIIIFKSDDYGDILILHNDFIEQQHIYFERAITRMVSKNLLQLSKFSYTCVGYFSSVIEAKVFVRSKRIELLRKRLDELPKNIKTPTGMISADLHPLTIDKKKSLLGELEKLDKWMVKQVAKYPELFIAFMAFINIPIIQ